MRNSLRLICSATALATLAACGGGSSSNSGSLTPSTLTGVAATGAAIAGGTVTAKCVAGAPLTGTTDANGAFTLALTATHTAPCMVQVTKAGPPAVELYSFAPAAGQVNISPLTDLVVAKALGGDAATTFNAFDATKGSTISGNLTAAKAYVQTQVQAITGSGTSDPLDSSFTVGSANDKVLDALGAAITAASGKTFADLRTGAQTGATLTATVPAFLGAPTGAAAVANGADQITLNWSAVTGATGYNVYRSTSTNVQLVSGNKLTSTPVTTAGGYAVTGLAASTAYYFKVTATSTAVSESTASDEASASTSAPTGTTPTATALTPTSGAGGSSITITGTNLNAVTQVLFTGPSPSYAYVEGATTAKSATSITATVPASLAAGSYTVTVVLPGAEVTVGTFTATSGGTGGGTTTPPTTSNPGNITLTGQSSANATHIASMVGHYAMPRGLLSNGSSLISDCTLDVAADGTFTVAGGGYSFVTSVTGKTVTNPGGTFMLDRIWDAQQMAFTVTAYAADKTHKLDAIVQNGSLVKLVSPGLTCDKRNPNVTTVATSDSSANPYATGSNLASSHVGTYTNADNCQLTIATDGTFHVTLPVASTLTSSTGWNGSTNVTSNATALDVTTLLGGDIDDKVAANWVTYSNGVGGNLTVIATDIQLLTGNYVSLTFYQSQNLGGAGGALGSTLTYLETTENQLSTVNRAVCNNMVKQ